MFVFNPPVTDFNWTFSGCASDSVAFHDNTNYVPGTYSYKWHWDFGDGKSDSVRNPKHLYASPGVYTVRFSLISNVGCLSDTSSKQITIAQQPIPKFGISYPECPGKQITFFDSSSEAPPGVLVKWYWDYGDGTKDSFSVSTNPTHIYPIAGTYNVTLTVMSNTGCKSNPYVFQLIVHPDPVVNFSLPQVCLPVGLAQFFDSSTIADGSQGLFHYLWNFGDPSSGALNIDSVKNPIHNYNNTGPFSVKLQVTSKDGCSSDTTKILSTIYPHPTDQSNGQGSTVTNWYWDFGDGQTSVLQNPKHLYSTPQTYTVKLVIKTDKGCFSDTASKQVTINFLPTASFANSTPLCETKTVTFSNASAANAGVLTLWAWNLGDGTLLNLNNDNPFTHTYNSAGSYTVTLQVQSDKGCKSPVLSRTIAVNAQPVADFILPQVCLNDAFAQFSDSSYITDGTASQFTYQWNFGDPPSGILNISALQNPIM